MSSHNPFLATSEEEQARSNSVLQPSGSDHNPFRQAQDLLPSSQVYPQPTSQAYPQASSQLFTQAPPSQAYNTTMAASAIPSPVAATDAMPSSPSATNPFRRVGSPTESAPTVSAAAPAPEVHHIADDLAGLDFGNGLSGSGPAATSMAPVPAPTTSGISAPTAASVDHRSTTVAQGTFDPPAGPPPALSPFTGVNGSGASAAAVTSEGSSSRSAGRNLLDDQDAQAISAADQADTDARHILASQTANDEAMARRLLEQQKLERRLGHGSNGVARGTNNPDEEAQWNLKDIYWRGVERKIITQNANGPCSLIALCNVLLLRGELIITPADRPAVSYSYLSSLLGEYLLTRPETESAGVDLTAALSILPRTQYGLDVNVRFDSVDSFTPSLTGNDANVVAHGTKEGSAATPATGELALFRLCNVKLVHGWLPDPADPETYTAVIKCGDYDKALDKVVEGDELAKGLVVEPNDRSGGATSAAHATLGSHLDRMSKGKHVESTNWSDAQANTVREALLIRDFLSSTSTQLSYHGLFVLAQTLKPGETVALFRNSHLSVLYRRLPEEGTAAAPGTDILLDGEQIPELFTLATDSAFLMEDQVVWESLADVDQAGSEFFDGKFRKTRLEGDWVGVDSRGRRAPGGRAGAGGAVMDSQGRVIPPGEDADFALAAQLQEEEQRRAAARHRSSGNRRGQGTFADPTGSQQQQQTQHKKKSSGLGALFGRKSKSKAAPSSAFQSDSPEEQAAGGQGAGAGGGSGSSGQRLEDIYTEATPPQNPNNETEKKEKCTVM